MKLLAKVFLFLAVASFATSAPGQETPTLYYVGGPTGDFNAATDFSTSNFTNLLGSIPGGGVPRAPNSSDIVLVNVDANSDLLALGFSHAGTVVLTVSQTNVVAGFQAANYIVDANTFLDLPISSGVTLTVTGRTGASGTGTVAFGDFVVEGGVTLNQTGGTLLVNQGLTVVGDNIHNGNFSDFQGAGTYNISSGAFSFDPATGAAGTVNELDIGSGAGSIGIVTQGAAAVAASGSTPAMPSTSSTVTTGNFLYIGYAGGNGTYNLSNGSLLQTGSPTNPIIGVGVNITAGTGSIGVLNITQASTLKLNSGADLQIGISVGGATGGGGTVTQNGVGSQVNILGTATMEIGDTAGSVGVYNLQSGSLNVGTDNVSTSKVDLGVAAGANGTLTQTGGVLTAGTASTFIIGDAGTGTYTISGGTADFKNGFTLGNMAASTGTVTQSGATVLTAEGAVTIGGAGTGVYNLNGGSATFSNGLAIGATGTLNLNGGTLTVGTASLTGAGTLDFGGGVLKFTGAGNFTDSFAGNVLAANTFSMIDASTTTGVNTVTFANPLSGAGGVAFIGNGNTSFDFTNATANSYTGPTSISHGNLNVSGADLATSSGVTIGSAGILNLSLGAASFSYPGVVNGTGTLNVNFNAPAETLTLANGSNSIGSVNIVLGAHTGSNPSATPGTLQVYSGSFGTISDNSTASSVMIGDNSGTSSGSVSFGNTTYTGTTTINHDFALTANNLDGSVVNHGTLDVTTNVGLLATDTVNNTGSLTAGSIAGTVVNSGSLFTLSSHGVTNTGTIGLLSSSPIGSTYNITGPLSSMGAGAVIDIRANGTLVTPADSIVATGAVTIDSASTIHVTGAGNIVTPVAIITGNGGLTVAPGALPNVNSGILFSPTLTVVGHSIDLTAVQLPTATFAMTPNQGAVATPVDAATSNLGNLTPGQQAALTHVLSGLNNLTTGAQVAAALEQLTPESLQYARIISFENSNLLVNRMNGVDADLRAGYGGLDTAALNVVSPGFGSGLGRSLGSLLAYDSPSFHPSAPNGVNYYPGGPDSSSPSSSPSSPPSPSAAAPWDSSSQVISDSPNPYLAHQNPSGPETPRFSQFIGGDVILADLNKDQSAANAPSSKANYTAGDASAGVSFRMTSHLAAGVLFDYNHTDADTDSSGSKTKVDTYSPGIFATYFDKGFYVNGLFSFGYNDYSNTRDISFANETASSHPSGRQYVGDLDFGYDFHPTNAWVVGPTLSVTYTHLDIDSFSESGAPGADLNVDSQSADSVRTRLGGHVIYQTLARDILLQPSITAMWQHEYLDNSSGITSSFNDFSSSPFTIQTAAPSRDSALIGCGLTATLSNSMAFYLNYLADVGADDYFAQSVIGGFKARF